MTAGTLSESRQQIAPAAQTTPVARARLRRRPPISWSWLVLALAFALVVVLGAIAPIRRTGDAPQYYAMALAFADLRPPALTQEEMAAFKAWRDAQPIESRFPQTGLLDQPELIADGRQEFSHFWFYPLLAAPFVKIADLLGMHPGRGFLIANALVLGFGLWRAGRSFGVAPALLLLASPIVWWIDKAQVEAFTVGFLAVAMAEARRGRFLWAALAAAVASTQNIPILSLVVCCWGAAVVRWWITDRTSRPDRASVALATASLLVGAAHPVYYQLQVGVFTPQERNGGVQTDRPTIGHYLAPVLDLNLGLVPWAPLLAILSLIGFVALLWGARRGSLGERLNDPRLTALCAIGSGLAMLFAFTQTDNLNSGGTRHIVRYALWLIPLTLPFLEPPARWLGRLDWRVPLAIGLVALPAYAHWFRPWQEEVYLVPSPQSTWASRWAPGLYAGPIAALRSPPEIFYERHTGRESWQPTADSAGSGDDPGSAATADCRVILLSRSAPFTRCQLRRREWRLASEKFEAGWRSVYIVREGDLGLPLVAEADVRGGADPEGWGLGPVDPAANLPTWDEWASRNLTQCLEQRCAPIAGFEVNRSVLGAVEYVGVIGVPGGEPSAVFLLFENGLVARTALGLPRADVVAAVARSRPDIQQARVMRTLVPTDALPWREGGSVCPVGLRVVDPSGISFVDAVLAPAACRLRPPPVGPAEGREQEQP